MRFDLVDLQLFIAVADNRSITRGADRSHLALASASARIRGWRRRLGSPCSSAVAAASSSPPPAKACSITHGW